MPTYTIPVTIYANADGSDSQTITFTSSTGGPLSYDSLMGQIKQKAKLPTSWEQLYEGFLVDLVTWGGLVKNENLSNYNTRAIISIFLPIRVEAA